MNLRATVPARPRRPRAAALARAVFSTHLALLTPSLPAAGSGFALPEQSAVALGRAGAVTASEDEPAAVWSNPATLAFAPSFGAALTGFFVAGQSRFSPTAGGPDTRSRPGAHAVPSVFAHARVHPAVTVGLGAFVPFGFAVRWPEGWPGAQQTLESQLYAATLAPVVAVRLTPTLAIAVGAGLTRGSVEYLSALPAEVGGKADLAGSAWGLTRGHLALFWRVVPERLHLGFTYHGPTKLDYSGDADFSPTNGAFFDLFVDQAVRAEVSLPETVTVGGSFRLTPALQLFADLGWTRWSRFGRLKLDFERGGTPDITLEQGTRNPLSVKTGVELDLTPQIALRAGASFDDTASEPERLSPFAPDARRLGLGLGAGYRWGRVRLDAGYFFAFFFAARANSPRTDAQAPPKGTYRTRVHVLGLGLSVF